MHHKAQQVCDRLAELVIASQNTDCEFSRIDGAEHYQADSLIFVADESALSDKAKALPAVIVTSSTIADQLHKQREQDIGCLITVSNVRLAQALIKQHYADYDASDSEWEAIHPSAVIHPSVTLATDVRVGPNSVIGRNSVIGKGTQIRSNCVIEHDVMIGDACIVNNLVNIGYGCKLGNRVIIRPGTIIGNEGFGFAQDDQRHYHRIPHTGIVEIEDDVQIGSNCNIDRATYGKTVLCKGVKIDALCHIAHNVRIDEDALFAGQSGIAGSSNIGKRVIASGHTGILDHKTIADDVVLVHRCGVTEDINDSGLWAGTPAKPFKDYVRNLSLNKKVAKLEEKLNALSRRFNKS